MASSRLTKKQQAFVDAYMGQAEGNATEAARLAGYSGNDATLRVTASRTLTNANVCAAIKKLQADSPLVASREERQRFWSEVMRNTVDGTQVAMRDRLKASELLGKTGRDFVEVVEHSGPEGGPIQTQSVDVSGLSDAALAELEEALQA